MLVILLLDFNCEGLVMIVVAWEVIVGNYDNDDDVNDFGIDNNTGGAGGGGKDG